MKYRICFVVPLALWAGLAPAQENPVDLDFARALDVAISNSAGLRAKTDAVAAEEYRAKEAASNYYPKLDAYSSYTRSSLQSDISIQNPLSGAATTISLFPENRYNFGLALTHDIYTFGRRSALKSSAEKGLARARIEEEDFRRSLYDATARTFAALLLARDNLSIQKENIARAEKKLKIVQSMIDQGLAADYDRIRAAMLLAVYRDRLARARGDFKQARSRLEALLLWDSRSEIMPVGEMEGISASLPELISFQPDSLNALKKMNLGYQILKYQQTVNKSALFPGIGLFAKYDWQNGYQPDIDKIRGDWSAGFSLNWRIFDGGARRSRLSQSRLEADQLFENMKSLRADVKSSMESAETEMESASERLSLARERSRLADDGLRVAESRYDQGLLRTSELIDVELEKAEARQNLLLAEYELLMARLDLKKSIDYYPELVR